MPPSTLFGNKHTKNEIRSSDNEKGKGRKRGSLTFLALVHVAKFTHILCIRMKHRLVSMTRGCKHIINQRKEEQITFIASGA
jgi:hypothetical protein